MLKMMYCDLKMILKLFFITFMLYFFCVPLSWELIGSFGVSVRSVLGPWECAWILTQGGTRYRQKGVLQFQVGSSAVKIEINCDCGGRLCLCIVNFAFCRQLCLLWAWSTVKEIVKHCSIPW